jgi:phosphate transport system substrate-binding protein
MSGICSHWDEVGGAPEQVTAISREEGSGTRAVFEALMMSRQKVTPTALIMPSSKAMGEHVASHPSAIGYLSMGLIHPGLKLLSVEGVQPSRQTVQDGSYRIVRPFLLVSTPERAGEVEAFVRFAASPAGQALVGQVYVGSRNAPG